MLASVDNYIKKNQLFNSGSLLIVATSGGKDSMAMVHYLKQEGYKIIVAHCNFQLRGAASDTDQKFIQNYCEVHQLPFETSCFETEQLAKERKLSIQEAARELRYTFLEDLRKKHKANVIVTAHHLNDNIETLIFNLAKGTGIKGMRGMLPKKGHVVRPFLETSVHQIWDYMQGHHIQFREDASNALTKYDRNKIRHGIMPVLEEINNNLLDNFQEHFKRWLDIEAYHELILETWRKKLFIKKGNRIFISIGKLKQLDVNLSLLFELLAAYRFNAASVQDMIQSFDSKDAKFFESSTHELIKDRKFLILRDKEDNQEAPLHLVHRKTKKIKFGQDKILQLHLKPFKPSARMSSASKYAYIDAVLVKFPLILRKWEPGDYMYPFGLTKESGKPSKKKIGKMLRDEKLSHHEKEGTWVLCSGDKIVWLLGHRLDDRFKVTDQTQEVFELELK